MVRVTIADANSGGLLSTLESLPAFIPYSHVPKNTKMSANVRCPARVHGLGLAA